jgi:hypothetical protein
MVSTEADRGGSRGPGDSWATGEEFLARVDVRDLAEKGDPFTRLFSPRFAEEQALGRYVRGLLAEGRWHQVHVVPHREGEKLSDHVFDIYGVAEA